MLQQDGFDFRRSHREALVLDHLLAAVQDVKKVVRIAPDNIPRPVPAVAENSSSGLGILPIAEHELRTAHYQFAGFTADDLAVLEVEHAAAGLDQGLAYGFGFVKFGGFKVADVGHRRGFGHAVSLADQDTGESGETARQLGSEGSGAGLHPAKAVVLGKLPSFGHLSQGVESWRHGWHGGDVLGDEKPEQLRHVEARQQDDGRPQDQPGIEHDVQAVDVIEGEEAENHIIPHKPGAVGAEELEDVSHQVEVGEHDALGKSGGAARIRQSGKRPPGGLGRGG